MKGSEETRENIINENVKVSKKILEIIAKARFKKNESQKPIQKTSQLENRDNMQYALAETYEIINHSSDEIKNKISPKFMEILVSAKDNSYVPNIDYEKPLEEQIQHETKIILGLIYRDYLCDTEKRQELIRNENELLSRIEKERNEKYSVDNLFKNRPYTTDIQQPNQIQDNEQNKMVEYKEENWYEKIINFFKRLFGKK